MRTSSLLRYPFAALLVCGAALACSSEDEGGGGGGGGGGGTNGGACFPNADECFAAGADGPGAECLAKHDNTGSTIWSARFSQIDVKAPAALAAPFINQQIVGTGVLLDQPQCSENGDGTFVWLFEYDSEAQTLRTGGGQPVTDPAAGACFVNDTIQGLPVAPITIDVTSNGDTFSASGINVNVPVFLDKSGDKNNVILLPLNEVSFEVTWNGPNCIGSFNQNLDPLNNCLPDYTENPPILTYNNGGSLNGYITIEQADQVFIDDIGQSLCAVLGGSEWQGDDGYCNSTQAWMDGMRPEGDWCSTTNAAATADCKDAYKLEAEFAASAIKINGECG